MNNDALKNKAGQWLLKNAEDRLKNWIVPRLPLWLETYHLTAMTFLWSALMVALFYWGKQNYIYFWFVPLPVILQYITDLLDGALGRYRDTGLVKWGFYADHFLDYLFLCSIIFGYALVVGFNVWIFLLLIVACGLMVHTFLMVSAMGEFQISMFRLGPTEGRLAFVIFHFSLAYFGFESLGLFLPFFAAAALLFLIIAAFE